MNVKTIQTKGQSALVEYIASDNSIKRCIIPSSLIIYDDVPLVDLVQGIEYGERWDELVDFQIGSRDLANELRRRGIWTLDDLFNDVGHAKGAANYLAAQMLKTLLDAARHMRERQ